MAEVLTAQFWTGLLTIIWVNIILSGDNAVVIALAARSLRGRQQKQAIIWGGSAAIVIRVILTVFAVKLLTLPSLKIIGGLLLFWIAVKLLLLEEGDGDGIQGSEHLFSAIKTIMIADLVMSLDNVIGVAAAAKGNITLLILGLAISIPLIVFGSTLVLKLMQRFPFIITLGAALLGYIAGELLVTDPLVVEWMELHMPFASIVVSICGALAVVAAGKWLNRSPSAGKA
ncbi:MAG TPA: TerC family protein [Burkholderiales bacterium]|nr:TerC family protein [Burkholderiales bacterium]